MKRGNVSKEKEEKGMVFRRVSYMYYIFFLFFTESRARFGKVWRAGLGDLEFRAWRDDDDDGDDDDDADADATSAKYL